MRPPQPLSPEMRRRIAVQGYGGLDDPSLLKLDPWIRLVPFVTGLASTFSTLLTSSTILMILAFVTAVSAALPYHPVDMIYNSFIRHLEQTPALPRTPARRRAVYLVWAFLLASASLCLAAGFMPGGIALGWTISAVILLVASQQLCLVSEALVRVFPPRPGP
jgi:hypothetical protein